MTERLQTILTELKTHAAINATPEFEWHWEIWGVNWYPWTIEMNGKFLSFSLNDISSDDLDELAKAGCLELIKVYTSKECGDEFDKRRYRII